MAEIVKRESGFDSKADNPTSTAYGYGQFLISTQHNYEKKMGLSYQNPVNQIKMMAQYIKDRYGTPAKALAFWKKHNWY
jgi:muramidase (phage lysozyme)